jgi:hypothetical protein
MFGLEVAGDVTAERRAPFGLYLRHPPFEADHNATVMSALPQRTFGRANFKQLSPEAIRPICDKD